jgi:uncharacterized cupredoxin-like copper-binding protein
MRCDMRIDVTKILWATAVGLLVVGLAVLAWGPSSSGSEGAGSADGAGVVEHVDDTDDGDVADEHTDDGSDHEDAGSHEGDADQGEEANAYLETAPKDSLALIAMTNFAFTPDTLEVNVGEVLEITIQNVESALHDFTIDEIDADVHISYLGGTGEHAHAMSETDADVHFALTEPGSGVVHLSVHEPGEYVIYCSVPGHREAGMVGKLIVGE